MTAFEQSPCGDGNLYVVRDGARDPARNHIILAVHHHPPRTAPSGEASPILRAEVIFTASRRCRVLLASFGFVRVGGQLLKEKFLSEVACRGAADTDGGIFERQSDALAILRWIEKI